MNGRCLALHLVPTLVENFTNRHKHARERTVINNWRMKKGNKLLYFGETIQGYDTPVLNEREVRAAAGLLFLSMFLGLMFVFFERNFLLIKYVVTVFLADLLIRVFVNPTFSPTLILGRLIVGRQTPEYVAAAQKKFAWKIGIALAGTMFLLLVMVNSYSIITVLSCFACSVFLFFESAFGICLGCLFYRLFYKTEVRHCAGDICATTIMPESQKITFGQLLVIFGFAVFILLLVVLFNHQFAAAPRSLWENVRLSSK